MEALQLRSRPFSSTAETLAKARDVVGRHGGIVTRYFEVRGPPDEPFLYHYAGVTADTKAFQPSQVNQYNGAASRRRDDAIARTIGECVERYSSGIYDHRSMLYCSENELSPERRERAISPTRFCLASERELSHPWVSVKRYDPAARITWVEGRELGTDQEVLLPGTFVYLPYKARNPAELFHRSISTGLGAGNTPEEAYLSGLCEVIERDAFMIMWHNELAMPEIDPASIDSVVAQDLIERFERCSLEVRIFDIRNDIRVPTFFVVVIDRNGRGPAVSIAASTSSSREHALISALEEVQHTRFWTRNLMQGPRPNFAPPWDMVDDKDKHVLLWSDPAMLPQLDWLLSGSLRRTTFSSVEELRSTDVLENLIWVNQQVQLAGLRAYLVDVTSQDVREAGFFVGRAVIPECQPLYLGTGVKYLGGRRLYDVPVRAGLRKMQRSELELNQIPHPFP